MLCEDTVEQRLTEKRLNSFGTQASPCLVATALLTPLVERGYDLVFNITICYNYYKVISHLNVLKN